MSIVPVILVMNDGFFLPYALESIRGFHRYVIYNAGSKDNTENIIDWFVETEKAEFYVRHLPFLDPQIQGIFRNSMIAETQSDWYLIVDGDEVYNKRELDEMRIWHPANHRYPSKIYGVFSRLEVNVDLTQRYSEKRTHHRLYHRDAIWKGPHPGEEPCIKQKEENEFTVPVTTYHFHNTIRSPLEGDVPKRIKRKSQGTYHPGTLIPFNLLEETPILRKPINNFPVNPYLEKLQKEFK